MTITKDQLQAAAGLLPGCTVLYQLDGSLSRLFCSPTLADMAGYTRQQLDSAPLNAPLALIYEPDRAFFLLRLTDCIKQNADLLLMCRLVHSDGHLFGVRVQACPVPLAGGETVVAVSFVGLGKQDDPFLLLNRIPTGLGIYQYSPKGIFPVFLNEGYYKMLHVERAAYRSTYFDAPMNAIHPRDREKLSQKLADAAQSGTGFSACVRMLAGQGEPRWIQADARTVEKRTDSTLFYISYTDVDARECARLDLEKTRSSLQANSSSPDVLCFEYDPEAHTARCYVDADLLGLPDSMGNFPQSLFESDTVYPEDLAAARDAAQRIESGENGVQCDVRLKCHGKYTWFSCRFTGYQDPDRQRRIVLGTVAGISPQKQAQLLFAEHQETVLRLNPDTIGTFHIDLTQNLCMDASSSHAALDSLGTDGTVDGLFSALLSHIDGEADHARFANLFTREGLLRDFANGKTLISMQHRFLMEAGATEWLQTAIDLVRNPATEHIEGLVYFKNISSDIIENMVLHESMRRGYERAAVVNVKNGEYFLFDAAAGLYGVHRTQFFESGIISLSDFIAPASLAFLQTNLTPAFVSEQLQDKEEYSAILPRRGTGRNVQRYRLAFSYIDRAEQVLFVTLRDFTDSVLLDELRYSSSHDRLTDLYNRSRTFAECRRLLDEYPEQQFIMAHFDIQRFRLLNSFFGEQEGDRLLCYLANLLRRCCADYDHCVFGRIEADVFCIFFPENKAIMARHTPIFSRALHQFRADFLLEPACGLYRVTDRSLSPEAMFSRATMAVRNNRRRLLIHANYYDDTMEQALIYEQQIVGDMNVALRAEQFEVYLQPKYNLADSSPCGAEALVRWNHPQRGMIMPGSFIPIFEKNGFILQFDRYMWEHVCRLLRHWLDAGYDPAPISVNVSRVSMYSPSTVPTLESLVQEYHIPPHLMPLELTESAYMDDPAEMKSRLLVLQKFGFPILMDDFGSGYSSLNTLKELPVDYLKVDMHFLTSSGDGQRSRLVLASVMRMASWLQLPVITEGVETADQAQFLRGIGCNFAQGYLFARPMPVSEYEKSVLHNCTVPQFEPNEQLSVMSQIITNTDFVSNYFTDHVPVPLAFIELSASDFSLIRASAEFVSAFGLGQELSEGSRLVGTILTREDHRLLCATFQKAASLGHCAECVIRWNRADEHDVRRFLVRARYLGRNACSSILLAAFSDVTGCGAPDCAGSISAIPDAACSVVSPQQLQRHLNTLNALFDHAQAVYPGEHRIYAPRGADARCFVALGGHSVCELCLAAQAAKHGAVNHVRKTEDGTFLVSARSLTLQESDGRTVPIVLEVATRLSSAVLRDLTGNEAISDNLHRLVYQDSLTSACNRRYFNEMLYLPPDSASRSDLSVGFVMLDLNKFKQLNDTYGHASGDRVLIQVAAELQRNVQSRDTVVRFGGDEFLVILLDYTQDQVIAKVEELRRALGMIRFCQEKGSFLSAGIGYSYTAHFQTHPAAVEALLQEADQAMYANKATQR